MNRWCLFILLMAIGWSIHPLSWAKTELVPEANTQKTQAKSSVFTKQAVVTANPYASYAGQEILKQGGSSIDAFIAAQLVLGLVEPQSSGIGGGAFLLYWDAKQQILSTIDGRETAPQAIKAQDLGDKSTGHFFDQVINGRAVGTPGVMALLYKAHKLHGRLPWEDLFVPSITLARKGFLVSPRLASLLRMAQRQKRPEGFKQLYYPDHKPLTAGTRFRNLAYAKALQRLATHPRDFYEGEIARSMVKAVATAEPSGVLSLNDLKNYQAIQRDPVCYFVFDLKMCGVGLPSSGALTILAQMGILEAYAKTHHLDLKTLNEADFWHLAFDAQRLAMLDRNAYMADPDWVPFPLTDFLSADYFAQRAKWMDITTFNRAAKAGDLPMQTIPGKSPEFPSTTHISIIDADGNAVSYTSSIEMAFGSRIVSEGFLLNNQLTDFSYGEKAEQKQVSNRLQANKRPRSSMSPMMVFNQKGQLVLVIGSPGGTRIIGYVAKTLLEYLVRGKTLAAAIDSPHRLILDQQIELEVGGLEASLMDALKKRGHVMLEQPQTSGIHAIAIETGQINAVADGRREGVAMGQ